jgi:ADP-ribose pyrophosphatase YjhB (NUDIX family)
MSKHKIQIHILKNLLSADLGLRYRDMKLPEIENDLYNYHLQYLLKEELIKKNDSLYFITDKGKKFVEDILPIDPLGQTSDLFRINVLCAVIRKNNGKIEILNQLRKRHPYYGDTGIIGGAVKKGEKIIDAANRKLFDETGLNADFKFVGTIRIFRFKSENELFTDILFHLCFAENFHGELKESTEFGDNFWLDLDSSIKVERESVMGSDKLGEILELLRTQDFSTIPMFYTEEKKILPSI